MKCFSFGRPTPLSRQKLGRKHDEVKTVKTAAGLPSVKEPLARWLDGNSVEQSIRLNRGAFVGASGPPSHKTRTRGSTKYGVYAPQREQVSIDHVLCPKMVLPENRTLAFSTSLFWGPILGTDWGSAEFYFGIRRVPFRRADT